MARPTLPERKVVSFEAGAHLRFLRGNAVIRVKYRLACGHDVTLDNPDYRSRERLEDATKKLIDCGVATCSCPVCGPR